MAKKRISKKHLNSRGGGNRRKKSTPQNWIYGLHAVIAALRNPDRIVRHVLATENVAKALQEWAGKGGLTVVGREDIERNLEPDAIHQGVTAQVEPLATKAVEDIINQTTDSKRAILIALDQACDPRNVGAVLRSAAAFGAVALLQQDRHAPPVTSAMAKSASGGLEQVSMVYVPNIVRALRQLKMAEFWIVGLDSLADTVLGTSELPDRCCLVLGAEGSGLRRLTREECDIAIKIPISEAVGSLNLSNAAAIALYEINRQ
ncbi:23S rRNA (guanosine(2251)-2'-O)-methyltransferase RlmB [Alphaproteobacteria bacterium]|nr:23S rRNA (guanosine(2251)-2'-O)-methyltransferase RlmB [Alphaproteobacteria bacterium]